MGYIYNINLEMEVGMRERSCFTNVCDILHVVYFTTSSTIHLIEFQPNKLCTCNIRAILWMMKTMCYL